MNKVEPINCSNCTALCCRQMGKIIPEFDRGDTICKYLDEDTNKCTIYEQRPFICDTVRIYNKYFKDKYTPEEWNEINQRACESLNEQYTESKEKVPQ